MGSANSVSMAYSEADPSAKQGDGEKSRTLIEDSNETKEEEEEESGECPLCTYISGGECKESWIALGKCMDDEAVKNGEETKCKEARNMFRTCMYDNPVYYEPILAVEAHVVAKMLTELQAEKEAILAGDSAAIAKALSKLQTEQGVPIHPSQAAAIAKAFQELEAEGSK